MDAGRAKAPLAARGFAQCRAAETQLPFFLIPLLARASIAIPSST